MKLICTKTFIGLGIFIAGIIVGGIVSFYISTYFLSRLHYWGTNLSKIVAIEENVYVLQCLQEGQTDKAQENLEMRLDSNLLFYSSGYLGPKKGRKDLLSALKSASDYRAKHPRVTGNREIDEGVARALALVDKER